MPKIVSRSAVSSSAEAIPTVSSAAALRVYYCLCGEFILVINKRINSLPCRKADDAYIVRAKDDKDGEGKEKEKEKEKKKALTYKLNVNLGDAVLVQRQNTYEKRINFSCPRCTLPVGYQTTVPPVGSGDFIYLIKGALTEIQGQTPPDAVES